MKLRIVIAALVFFFASLTAHAQCSNFTPNVGFGLPIIGATSAWGTCLNTNFGQLDALLGGVTPLALNSATPSVIGKSNWSTNSTVATTITNFTGGYQGQQVRILCKDTNTTILSNSSLALSGSFSCASSTGIALVFSGTVWTELGRGGGGGSSVSVNGASVSAPNLQDSNSYFYQVTGSNVQLFPQFTEVGPVGIVNGNFVMPCFFPTSPQPSNCPFNPPQGWSVTTATLSYDQTTAPPNNLFSLKITCVNSSTDCTLLNNTAFTLIPGQTYTATGYVRGDGTIGAQLGFEFEQSANPSGDMGCFSTPVTSTTWTFVTVSCTAGNHDNGLVYVTQNNDGASTAGSMWVQDVQIYNNSLAGPNVTKVLNGVSYSANYSGASLDVRVNACLADAMARTNGNTTGMCSSEGEPYALTSGSNGIQATITVGAPTTLPPVTWILPAGCEWESNTPGAANIFMYPGARIISWGGLGAKTPSIGFGTCVIQLSNGGSTYMLDTGTTGGQFTVENIQFKDGSHSLSSGALIHVGFAEDQSYFGNVGAENQNASNAGWLIGSTSGAVNAACCDVTFERDSGNAVYTGGVPWIIQLPSGSGSGAGMTFRSITADHPTASEPAFECIGTSTTVATPTLTILGIYEEGFDGVTSTELNDVNGCGRVTVIGDDSENFNGNAANNAPIWQIENTTVKPNFNLIGLTAHSYASGTLGVNNLAASTTVPLDSLGNLPSYSSGISYVDNIADNALAASSDVCTNASSVLSTTLSNCPKASNSSLGIAQCDGTTITCSAGVMTSVTGGAGTWTGSGTAGKLPLITGTTALGNSNESDNGTTFSTTLPFTSTGLLTGVGLASSGVITDTAAGAASTPGLSLTGTPFTGGTATTTVPYFYINQGTAPTSWVTTGTELGINSPSGWSGFLVDLHANGGTSVFNIQVGGVVTAAGSVNSSGNLQAGAGQLVFWNSRSVMESPVNGVIELANNAVNGFTRLDLGGTTSSFPGLCTSGVALSVCDASGGNAGTFSSPGYFVGGTTFTASGCTNGTLVGGATSGSFLTGASGACTITITMGNSQTAPHGWSCWGSDQTTTAGNPIYQSGGSTTTAILVSTASTASGDKISFGCLAY